ERAIVVALDLAHLPEPQIELGDALGRKHVPRLVDEKRAEVLGRRLVAPHRHADVAQLLAHLEVEVDVLGLIGDLLQDVAVVLVGALVGVDPLEAVAGSQSKTDRAVGAVAPLIVERELLEDLLLAVPVLLLVRGSHLAVIAAPLLDAQLRVEDLAHLGLLDVEMELSTLEQLVDETGLLEIAKLDEDGRRGEAFETLEELRADRLVEDGHRLEHLPVDRIELREPLLEEILHAARDLDLAVLRRLDRPAVALVLEDAFVLERLERLDEEERVSAGLLLELRGEVGGNIREAERRLDELLDMLALQAADRRLDAEAAGFPHLEELLEPLVSLLLGALARQSDQAERASLPDRLLHVRVDLLEQIDARVIDPVEVVDAEDERHHLRRVDDELRELVDEALLLLLRPQADGARAAASRRELGKELVDVVLVALDDPRARPEREDELPEDLDQRLIGFVVRLVAVAAEDLDVVELEEVLELLEEARLSGAHLAGDEHEVRLVRRADRVVVLERTNALEKLLELVLVTSVIVEGRRDLALRGVALGLARPAPARIEEDRLVALLEEIELPLAPDEARGVEVARARLLGLELEDVARVAIDVLDDVLRGLEALVGTLLEKLQDDAPEIIRVLLHVRLEELHPLLVRGVVRPEAEVLIEGQVTIHALVDRDAERVEV